MRHEERLKGLNNPADAYWAEMERFQHVLAIFGSPVRTDPEGFFPKFQSGTIEQKLAFLNRIKLQRNLFEEAITESIPIIEDVRFVWLFFKRNGLRPPSDLFEKLGNNDYIEIYDPNGLQLFANLEFGRIISYSIEETYWHRFDELYRRESIYTEQLLGEFAKCFTNSSGPFRPNISDHVVQEVFSKDKRKASVGMKLFSPVFGLENRPCAMIGASKLRLLS